MIIKYADAPLNTRLYLVERDNPDRRHTAKKRVVCGKLCFGLEVGKMHVGDNFVEVYLKDDDFDSIFNIYTTPAIL